MCLDLRPFLIVGLFLPPDVIFCLIIMYPFFALYPIALALSILVGFGILFVTGSFLSFISLFFFIFFISGVGFFQICLRYFAIVICLFLYVLCIVGCL